jgi:hypothetical protein
MTYQDKADAFCFIFLIPYVVLWLACWLVAPVTPTDQERRNERPHRHSDRGGQA